MSDDPRRMQVEEEWRAYEEHGQRQEFAQAEAACQRALRTLEAMQAERPSDPGLHFARGATLGRLAHLCLLTNRRDEEADHYRRAIPALQAAVDGQPDLLEYRGALAATCYSLGTVESQSNRLPEAEAWLLRAITIQQAIVQQHPDDLGTRNACAQSQFNLGNVYLYSERPEQARACFLAARSSWQQLDARQPDLVPLLHDLARCHFNLAFVSEPAEGLALYRTAMGIWAKVIALHPHHWEAQYDLARCAFNVCVHLQKDRAWDEALALAEQGAGAFQKLALAFPNVEPYLQSLGQSVQQWNQIVQAAGPPERVLDVHRQSFALMESVLQQRGDFEGLRNIGINHLQAAAWFSDIGRRPELAQEIYRDAEAYFLKLRSNRTDAETDHLLAAMYQGWASLRGEKVSSLEQREERYRRGLRIWQALTAAQPEEDRFQHGLAASHNDLGILYRDTGRLTRAQHHFQASLQVRQQIEARHPGDPDNRAGLAGSLCNLGSVAVDCRNRETALLFFGESATLLKALLAELPAEAPIRPFCEHVQRNIENGQAAAAALPDRPEVVQSATISPRPEGPPPRVDTSIEVIDARLREAPGDRQLRRDKADVLRWHGASLAALLLLDELLHEDPTDAQAWYLRGLLLSDQQGPGGGMEVLDHDNHEQALDAFDEAILLVPNFFEARFHKGLTLKRLAHAAQARHRGMAERLKDHGPEAIRPYETAFFATVHRARESLEEASRLRPGDPRVWEALAMLFTELFGTRDSPAEDYFVKLVECDPGRADAWYQLAEIADQRGSRGDALERLKRAIALQPNLRDRAFNDFPWITARKLS